jgi:hypothetical protein
MARVVNELIDVMLAGPARVKQYSGAGPLIVKLPGDRGEYRAQSGDYLCYDGDACVGIVGGPYFDALREDKDTLVEEETSTGAHLETTMLDNAGAPLPNTMIQLAQAGAPPIAEGRTNAEGVVYFNVLPGTYLLRPKDKTKGPEQQVEAVIEPATPPEPPPVEGGALSGKGGPGKPFPPSGPGKPDQGLPKPIGGQIGGPKPDHDLPGHPTPKS